MVSKLLLQEPCKPHPCQWASYFTKILNKFFIIAAKTLLRTALNEVSRPSKSIKIITRRFANFPRTHIVSNLQSPIWHARIWLDFLLTLYLQYPFSVASLLQSNITWMENSFLHLWPGLYFSLHLKPRSYFLHSFSSSQVSFLTLLSENFEGEGMKLGFYGVVLTTKPLSWLEFLAS